MITLENPLTITQLDTQLGLLRNQLTRRRARKIMAEIRIVQQEVNGLIALYWHEASTSWFNVTDIEVDFPRLAFDQVRKRYEDGGEIRIRYIKASLIPALTGLGFGDDRIFGFRKL